MEIELLNSERLTAWGRRLNYPQEAIDALQAVASLVRGDPELSAIFAEFHERTALRGEWHREWADLPVDERVEAKLGQRASLFYLLAYMAALPYVEVRYRQLGINRVVFHDTMKDFLNYLGDFYDLHGYWGYSNYAWIWRHLTCELFRLGRLQYMLLPFPHGVTAFQRKRVAGRRAQGPAPTGVSSLARVSNRPGVDGDLPDLDILLLADPERPLRTDGNAYGIGQFPGDDEPLPPEVWKPVFEASEAGWRGHLVTPYGVVQSPPVFLPRLDWDLILQKGDTVLDLHIPRKDPLTVETCRDSFQQAVEFFPRIYPDRPFKALYCHTWFFTIQLQTMLQPESKIVQFQREFYLYPYPGSVGYLWSFVFGEKNFDPYTAPRDTTLRRAVLDWMDQGKEIFDLPGVLFHSPQEWGTQPYMRVWDKVSPKK